MERKKRIIKKTTRCFLIIVAVLAISIACISVIFYASGYQVNWKAKKIEKTGLLVIENKGKDIEIIINGELREIKKSRTPTGFLMSNISISLLPGKYDIEIREQNALPYKKSITISPELITKIENIVFIPKDLITKEVLDIGNNIFSLSPHKDKVIYQRDDGKVVVFDIKSSEEFIFENEISSGNISSIKWKEDGSLAIATIEKDSAKWFYFLELGSDKKTFTINNRFSFLPKIDSIYFSQNNQNELLGFGEDKIYKLNTSLGQVEEIEKNVNVLSSKDGFLFYYKKDENNIFKLETNVYNKTVLIESLAPEKDFSIITINNQDIYLLNDKSIFLVKDKNNLELLDKDVTETFASTTKMNFFYTKGGEIWLYNHDKKDKNMLTRFSNEITGVAEMEETGYILYKDREHVGILNKEGDVDQEINKNQYTEIGFYDKNKIVLISKENKVLTLDLNQNN